MYVTAIIAAGGRGRRFGGALPKQLVAVGGRAMLERSVRIFVRHPAVDELIVAVPPEVAADPPPYLTGAAKPLRIVVGGASRQESVAHAFRAVSERTDVVVVHDAARPFASADLVARTIAAAAESGAAVAAVPARDTVKRAVPLPASSGRAGSGGSDAAGAPNDASTEGEERPIERTVAETLPREAIFLAQTPQAFRREVLRDALALGERDATDEATLAERAGHDVRIVGGEITNIKVTTREDLPMAEAIARAHDGPAAAGVARIGTGYDLHRLVEGRPLILGGIAIPFDRGLLGHSDADAVCHAVTDAVLGAAAAGDIGRHFPDSDPRWRGASSLDLLRRAAELVRDRGFTVLNADVVVIAERPRLGPFIEAMREKVAGALGIAADRVSIKGKTNEGIGALGRGEAIAVHAVAALGGPGDR